MCCSSVCHSDAWGMPRGLKRARGVRTPPVLLQQAVRRTFALEKEMTHREIRVDVYLFHGEAVTTCVQSCNKCVDVSSGVSITFFSLYEETVTIWTALEVLSLNIISSSNFFYASQLLWKGSEKPLRNTDGASGSGFQEDTDLKELDLCHGCGVGSLHV